MVYAKHGYIYPSGGSLAPEMPALSPIPNREGPFAVLEVLLRNNPIELMRIAEDEIYARKDKFYYYKKAADLDHPEACFKVGEALSRKSDDTQQAIFYLKKAACLGNIDALKMLQNNQKKLKLSEQELQNIAVLYLLKNFEKENFKLTDFEIDLLKKINFQLLALTPGQNVTLGMMLHNLLRTYTRPQENKGLMTKLTSLFSSAKSDATPQQELQQLNLLAYEFLRKAALSEDRTFITLMLYFTRKIAISIDSRINYFGSYAKYMG